MKRRAAQRRLRASPTSATEGKTCAHCGWSWAAGSVGQLLCTNPESPYCYDTVPLDLCCAEQAVDPCNGM
jgi:hypothetical protein